jgi:hypothetical protein
MPPDRNGRVAGERGPRWTEAGEREGDVAQNRIAAEKRHSEAPTP